MASATTTTARGSVLVVWDFDWSLVNENSDTWVVRQLGEELMPNFRSLRKEEQLGWTQVMNRQMRSLWEKGVTESEIKWSMSRLPVFQRMLDAACMAAAAGAEQAIVSDANTVFIEEFLKHHGIRSLFGRGITTNGGVFKENGRLDVQPHHSDPGVPHGCSLCPPNMCKGLILDGLLATQDGNESRSADKVIYVGDGGGDYCPALRLRPGDLLLARHGEKEGRSYGLRQRIEKGEGGAIVCRMLSWDTGEDVYAAFERELEGVREPSGDKMEAVAAAAGVGREVQAAEVIREEGKG